MRFVLLVFYTAAGEKGLRFEKMLAIKVTRELSNQPTKQPSVRPGPHSLPRRRRRRRAFVNRHEAKTASLRRASCAPIFYQHNAHKKVLAEIQSLCYVAARRFAASGEKISRATIFLGKCSRGSIYGKADFLR